MVPSNTSTGNPVTAFSVYPGISNEHAKLDNETSHKIANPSIVWHSLEVLLCSVDGG